MRVGLKPWETELLVKLLEIEDKLVEAYCIEGVDDTTKAKISRIKSYVAMLKDAVIR